MTDYLKNDEAFKTGKMVFQPVTLEGVEVFSVWDNQNKKFIREGETLSIESGDKKVDKYIKLSDNDKKRFNRSLKINRNIIFNGKEFSYSMPMSVNEQLLGHMSTIQKMGKDPLSFEYAIGREGKGIETRYSVSVEGEVSLTPSKKPAPQISIDVAEDVDEDIEDPLTPDELRVLDAVKKKYPNYAEYDNDVWVDLLVRKLGISNERAVFVVGEYLNV